MKLTRVLALLCLLPAAHGAGVSEEMIFRAEQATASLDDKRGHARYEGNAELVQGGRRLQADVIDFETRDGQVSRVEATGSPVVLQDQDQTLDARANHLVYDVSAQTLHLKGSARISQQGRQFEGEELEYDLAGRRIRARGGAEDGRIRLVIPANDTTVTP